jgi:signal transduction histidine kinase
MKNKFRSIWIFALITTIFLIVSLYLTNIILGIEDFSNAISLPIYTIIPGTLVILSIWAVTRSNLIKELPRNSLIFLALSFTFWFLAEQTWNLYEHVFLIDPYPSIADFFYVFAPIFMLISLSIFLKSTGKKVSKKNIMFSCIISLIFLVPSLIFLVEVGVEDEPLEIAIALSYPIVDALVLIPVVITILFLISNKQNFFWFMILIGMLIMITADSVFLFLIIVDEYKDGHPVDILWVTSYTIWSFMLIYIISKSKKDKESDQEFETFKIKESNKWEKYGVLLSLVFINSTVVIVLVIINYIANPGLNDTTLAFFSWIFIMTIVIFSSIVILLNSKLNKTLQNRTKQLEKTTQELVKSERFSAIGELASRISHDIRNPLSNIKMSIELIKNSPPNSKISDDTINEKLKLVSKNIERISHQVNDVLEFVQDREMKKEEFMIHSCLQDTIKSIHIPKNIIIKTSISEKKVFADYFQLQIVFNNLIINAIQAIGVQKGEIIIHISETGKNIIIQIENSGPSIPKEVLPHIFETLVTTKQIGTGLGLVSCKTIIENHKGSIVAKNNPTTFVITLPK